MSVHGLLVTGPPHFRDSFHRQVFMKLNPIDSRKETSRYACMDVDLELAVAAAKQFDVTLQEIVTTGTKNPRTEGLGGGASVTISDCIEDYPVLHLGTHGMKWGKVK